MGSRANGVTLRAAGSAAASHPGGECKQTGLGRAELCRALVSVMLWGAGKGAVLRRMKCT